jgi:hypothetical protein
MRIESIVCPEYIEEKLQAKHGVTCYEAEQVLLNRSRIRFAEKVRSPVGWIGAGNPTTSLLLTFSDTCFS